GVDNDTVATRSVVKTHNIADGLELSFRPDDRMEFSAKANINYQHSTSPRMGFNTIDAFTFNYGATAQIELPWNMQLATDITMYSRRGYSDESMNTNELVWNARLTKRLMHGNLLIQLDGFDLLGNLSNVTRYIDAQGKTETFYNVIPSYALLHVVWRLNKEPKKRE
ncbi:MAG: outer membrane beta-barrel protein, partial [Prevotellaceae bacterium]|nr:outer membrane beta-barrel protein [Candidatus Colivivens caballi]